MSIVEPPLIEVKIQQLKGLAVEIKTLKQGIAYIKKTNGTISTLDVDILVARNENNLKLESQINHLTNKFNELEEEILNVFRLISEDGDLGNIGFIGLNRTSYYVDAGKVCIEGTKITI